MFSTILGSTAVALVASLVLAGSVAADTHDEGDGRLSASSGSGGFIVDAPVHRAYWAAFGEWALCDTARDDGITPADTITITGVRYAVGRRQPLEIRAYLRTVTPHAVASHPGRPAGAYGPFIGLVGRPRDFHQPYATGSTPGRYSRSIAGTAVTRGCDATRRDAFADSRGNVPRHAWTSLVLAVKVGRHAGRVRRTLIDYTVGDTSHTLRITWAVGGQGYLRHPASTD